MKKTFLKDFIKNVLKDLHTKLIRNINFALKVPYMS